MYYIYVLSTLTYVYILIILYIQLLHMYTLQLYIIYSRISIGNQLNNICCSSSFCTLFLPLAALLIHANDFTS